MHLVYFNYLYQTQSCLLIDKLLVNAQLKRKYLHKHFNNITYLFYMSDRVNFFLNLLFNS